MNPCPFQPNSAFWISGPSRSGKTNWVSRFLHEKDQLYKINDIPRKILYCYEVYQPIFTDMEKNISNFNLHKGLPSKEMIQNFSSDRSHNLLVLDDLMTKIINDEEMLQLFTIFSHHWHLTVIFITQNLFPPGKFTRTIALNTTYMILFRNVRDSKQITLLGSQIFPGNTEYIKKAYLDATSKPFGYLIIDLSPHVEDNIRLRTNIFPEEEPVVVYLDK